jgi:hypothetical protein
MSPNRRPQKRHQVEAEAEVVAVVLQNKPLCISKLLIQVM